MLAALSKDSIDLGIVTKDFEASVAFYRDLLGFDDEGEMPMPGGKMQRLRCGTTLVKLVSPQNTPPAEAPPGGIQGATGYRYFTLCVTNLDEIGKALEAKGVTMPIPPTEIRPGVKICMVEDPDGNWVEFAQY